MRRELFEVARSFGQERTWLQIKAIFGPINEVERLLYEAEQRLSGMALC